MTVNTPFPLQSNPVQYPTILLTLLLARVHDLLVQSAGMCPASFWTANGSAPLFSKSEMAECRRLCRRVLSIPAFSAALSIHLR
jgi:hypothetical protein